MDVKVEITKSTEPLSRRDVMAEVMELVVDHHYGRKPIHAKGMYHSFVRSQASACWSETIEADDLSISVCCPSPSESLSKPVVFFDYIIKEVVTSEDK